MIIEVNEVKSKMREYPYIGRSDSGVYVLFSDAGRGTVVLDIGNCCKYEVGYFSDNWTEYDFEEFKGTITITC